MSAKIYGIGTSYHGCGNTFISEENPGLGTYDGGYKKVETIQDIISEIKKHPKKYGYCILEPVQLDASPERIKFLKELRAVCTKKKIILIFDEVITGLRFPGGSVSAWSGVKPDLMCVGKAIGNGYPFSAVLGSEELMEQDYFWSNTHNANEIALKKAKYILESTTDNRLIVAWKNGNETQDTINGIIKELPIKLVGYGTRGEWQGDLNVLTALWELLATKGYIVGRAFFWNANHIYSIFSFYLALQYAVDKIKDGYKRKGRCVKFSFKRN
jgi:glutamate-1-semialdehyde aminotransferase